MNKQKELLAENAIDKEWQQRRNRVADKLVKMQVNEVTKSMIMRIEAMLDTYEHLRK